MPIKGSVSGVCGAEENWHGVTGGGLWHEWMAFMGTSSVYSLRDTFHR
jgi:hypothetical protein